MPAEVETMMYNVENGVPWHGLGRAVQGAADSEEALVKSGLLWAVEKRHIYVDGRVVGSHVAITRTTDGKVLGVVSDRYQPVQNREAFAWTDALLGEGVRYETAGSLREGRRIWLLARLEEPIKIAGDDTLTYLVFSNSHDGNGAIKVALTPVRVVCANTLAWALQGATRTWSARHVGNPSDKLEEARRTLEIAHRYMDCLAQEAEILAGKRVDLEEYVARLIPLPDDVGAQTACKNVLEKRADILTRAQVDDLIPFRGTAWQFLQAMADHVSHAEPKRRTSTFKERRFERITDGDPLLQQAHDLVVRKLSAF